MLTHFLIWWHKRQMKTAYLAYRRSLERLSCGKALARSIPSVQAHRNKVNYHLAKLQKHDPRSRRLDPL